jgi:hypothetical protein
MKLKLFSLSLISSVLATSLMADNDLRADLEALKQEVATLKQTLKKAKISNLKNQVKELKVATGGDNLKLSADLRASYDFIEYKLADGTKVSNNIMANRVRINMDAMPREDLIFKSQFQVNKLYGHSQQSTQFNGYDWFTSETPDDATMRLKEAYFVYFGDAGDVPYTLSFGRRPSVTGITGNFRDDDAPSSPTAHTINLEFDGASLNFKLEDQVNIPGFAIKLCGGRGYSNADSKYNMNGMPYIENASDTSTLDMMGTIIRAYDDGQYSVVANLLYAQNVLGLNDPMDMTSGFQSVGDLEAGSIVYTADGIGDMINDFLDGTKFFASIGYSKTHPNSGQAMLGSTDSEIGYSFWTGVQFPCPISEGARVGLEYNQGSKYWRAFTYGEDTMIGSKTAARGKAYEAYWTKDLVDKTLSMQLRYTYIDYDYTGSDMFFGGTGMPMDPAMMNSVDKASDFRAYIRYRY